MLDKQRTEQLIAEARDELRRFDDLRANTREYIATLEKRLELLGANPRALPLPGVEPEVKPNGKPNTELFIEALERSRKPLTSREVWAFARANGARSNSTRPERATDTMLRELARRDRIEIAGKGLYKAKRAQESA